MKKPRRKVRSIAKVDFDEILPEYDFSDARPNKYAARYTSLGNAPQREVGLQGSVPLDNDAMFTLGFSDVEECRVLVGEMNGASQRL